MKTSNILLLIILPLFYVFSTLQAQVTSVDYQIKYNSTSCLFECFLIVNSGSANSISERIQFNSQFSILTPTGADLTIVETYMPLVNNIEYDSNTPTVWSIAKVLTAPIIMPNHDFYSIVPNLTPLSRYNNLNVGDTIKLFSFSLDNFSSCSQYLRLFENGIDPPSNILNGSDFTQGFTIGGSIQRYNANAQQVSPPNLIMETPILDTTSGIEIDMIISSNTCHGAIAFDWIGPNNFMNTTEDISIIPSTDINDGPYRVIVSSESGCRDTAIVLTSNKPYAGENIEGICPNDSILVEAIPGGGNWSSFGLNNPDGSYIDDYNNGKASIRFNSDASGTYNFYYHINGNYDTLSIKTIDKPTIELNGNSELCIGQTSSFDVNTIGSWVSNTPSIAVIDQNGLITAISPGIANFSFISDSNSCITTSPYTITVLPNPEIIFNSFNSICINDTFRIIENYNAPNLNWFSSNSAIATIDNMGLVTGIGPGIVNFGCLDITTGCYSAFSSPLTVLPEGHTLCSTGTNNYELDNINLFPIPANNTIFITNLPLKFEIQLHNISGIPIELSYFINKSQIELNTINLANGMYLMTIKTGNEKLIKKFTILK